MRPPRFWDLAPNHIAARMLAPLGAAYGIVTAARMDRAGAAAPCPVLCLGNFTLGGAGKTPTALCIAGLLRAECRIPAFLSRGYGGRLKGPVAVDPRHHDSGAVGDEPLLLAREAPTIVSGDRVAGAALAVRMGADVIVMDDGLQNPSLTKTLSFAVVDAGTGLGNGLPFPAGPLRVPLARQWRHVGGVVLIGDGAAGEAVAREAARRGLPVHRGRLVAEGPALAGRRTLAFAGIGRPQKFFDTLAATGAEIVRCRAFADHHPYREAEIASLWQEAQRLGAELITTEKDAVRLPPAYADRVGVLPVRLRFADDAPLRAQLRSLTGGPSA